MCVVVVFICCVLCLSMVLMSDGCVLLLCVIVMCVVVVCGGCVML